MLILLPVALLLLALILMQVLHLVRPGFASQWLVAVGSLFLVEPILLLLRSRLPLQFSLPAWQPQVLFPVSPTLLLDTVSWSFSISVVTLALAVLLTAAARLSAPVDWRPWAGTLALAGMSLLAVQAGNPLTLLLAWVALDLVDFLIVLVQVRQSAIRELGVLALAARMAGIVMLVWSLMLARSQGAALNFQAIPALVAPYLLIAAGLRLGVIPLQVPLLEALSLRRGLGTSLRLLPAASSLMLLVRASAAGVPAALVPYLIALIAIAALYSSLSWLLSTDELSGRPFWILTVASLAITAAVRGNPQATLSWSLVLLLAGTVLFLYVPRHSRLLPIVLIGLFGISALPFSPTWAGLAVYGSGPLGSTGVLLRLVGNAVIFASHTLLLVGYLRYALMLPGSQPVLERWAWLVYPLGLVLPVLVMLGLGWIGRPVLADLSLVDWLLGLFTLACAVAVWAFGRDKAWGRSFENDSAVSTRTGRLLADFGTLQNQPAAVRGTAWSTTIWAGLLSLTWLYRLAWWLYRGVGRVLGWLNRILEGEGGLVWAFVLLALLLTLFVG